MTEDQLRGKLENLPYPCYFVVHGPARDYRTRYRGEHHGVFASGVVGKWEEAWGLIQGTRYPGFYSEMDLVCVYFDAEDRGLREITL